MQLLPPILFHFLIHYSGSMFFGMKDQRQYSLHYFPASSNILLSVMAKITLPIFARYMAHAHSAKNMDLYTKSGLKNQPTSTLDKEPFYTQKRHVKNEIPFPTRPFILFGYYNILSVIILSSSSSIRGHIYS